MVESIFKKAQNEPKYSQFYAELCEKLIFLEIGHASSSKKMNESEFRKLLMNHCKDSFYDFRDKNIKSENFENDDEREKYEIFKSKFLGSTASTPLIPLLYRHSIRGRAQHKGYFEKSDPEFGVLVPLGPIIFESKFPIHFLVKGRYFDPDRRNSVS